MLAEHPPSPTPPCPPASLPAAAAAAAVGTRPPGRLRSEGAAGGEVARGGSARRRLSGAPPRRRLCGWSAARAVCAAQLLPRPAAAVPELPNQRRCGAWGASWRRLLSQRGSPPAWPPSQPAQPAPAALACHPSACRRLLPNKPPTHTPPPPPPPLAAAPDPLLDAVLLHLLSHCAKAAARIKKNNERLRAAAQAGGGAAPLDAVPKDQGFTRAKVRLCGCWCVVRVWRLGTRDASRCQGRLWRGRGAGRVFRTPAVCMPAAQSRAVMTPNRAQRSAVALRGESSHHTFLESELGAAAAAAAAPAPHHPAPPLLPASAPVVAMPPACCLLRLAPRTDRMQPLMPSGRLRPVPPRLRLAATATGLSAL